MVDQHHRGRHEGRPPALLQADLDKWPDKVGRTQKAHTNTAALTFMKLDFQISKRLWEKWCAGPLIQLENHLIPASSSSWLQVTMSSIQDNIS